MKCFRKLCFSTLYGNHVFGHYFMVFGEDANGKFIVFKDFQCLLAFWMLLYYVIWRSKRKLV